jgi:Lon protease-like protein
VQALTEVPLFPLPGHVLLPGLVTPFHIFEPRYRTLIRDVSGRADGQRFFAVPRIKPGYETAAAGAPPLVEVVTLAHLVDCHELPDGRFVVAVVGEGRWRLTEQPSPRAYRLARLQRMPEPPLDFDMAERLAACVRRVIGVGRAVPEDMLALLDIDSNGPGVVLDRLAALTLVDPDLRQRYLDTISPCCRLRVLEGAESSHASCSDRPSVALN